MSRRPLVAANWKMNNTIEEAEAFLADFLPELERQPGVVAVYHFTNTERETAESTTIVVWRDDASRVAYRQSDLAKRAFAYEAEHGLAAKRSAFHLTYPAAGQR